MKLNFANKIAINRKFLAFGLGQTKHIQKRPPCVKGARAQRVGDCMQYKHSKSLVPTARMLRKSMTREERHLWYDFLRFYPVRFLRPKVLGQYIADFYCAKAKLVVELDGSQHSSKMGIVRDEERTAFLEQYGLRVIRIPNQMIWKDFARVCAYIDDAVQQSLSRLTSLL